MVWPGAFINKIICGDCLEILKIIPSESINCCITSPPYWALRDYGVEGQLGLESTFHEYLDRLIAIFDEVKRVLRKDGTCWVVLGDTYNSNHKAGTTDKKTGWKHGKLAKDYQGRGGVDFLPIKALLQIPSRFAILMTDHGWILRNEIIWYKPNAMPSSVKDRFTVDFEKVFFFVKEKKYWFEQQLEPYQKDLNRWGGNNLKANGESIWDKGTWQKTYRDRSLRPNNNGRNKRCVWQVPTQSFKEAHFAVFPPTLVEPMIKAGCPENGIVLDPFMGSGTVAEVALKLNRRFVGIELNPEYIKIAKKRIREIQPQLVF